MNQLSERYLEDFAVGQTFGSGRLRIDGERALAFAAGGEMGEYGDDAVHETGAHVRAGCLGTAHLADPAADDRRVARYDYPHGSRASVL